MTNQQPRSEDEQVTRAGFGVRLGARAYVLRPKTIKDSKAWKAQFAEVVEGLGSTMNLEMADLGNIVGEVSTLLGGSDDLMLDLLGAYSAEIDGDREDIEATATSGEAWDALLEVLRVEFPFLRNMGRLSAAQAAGK